MSWTDFEEKSALERDMLERAVAIVPTVSDGRAGSTIYQGSDRRDVNFFVSNTSGPTPAACVDLLAIRPLLFGTAWKVLDLLLEEAFGPNVKNAKGWRIQEKGDRAAQGLGQPSMMGLDAWRALTALYRNTTELRHSLVHRKVYTDDAHSLVGQSLDGSDLRPLGASEQEALCRVALRASVVVTRERVDARDEQALLWELKNLQAWHEVSLHAPDWSRPAPTVEVVIPPELGRPGRYRLDLLWIRSHRAVGGRPEADLIIRPADRPGISLRGRLEDAPEDEQVLDLAALPDWLS